MSFSWRNGAALGALLAVGVVGAVILAQSPPDRVTVRAVVSSDDDFGFGPTTPPPAPPVDTTPVEAPLTPTPSSEPVAGELPVVTPIATYACNKRTGDAKRPIHCNGSKRVHAWLTVTLRQQLPKPVNVALEEYAENPVDIEPTREIGRYVHLSSTINPSNAKGALVRIVYTATDIRDLKNGARALAIAAYDANTERWVTLPSTVNLRGKFVQASFATKRLPEQLFALVEKP